jgi:hypothetical protein
MGKEGDIAEEYIQIINNNIFLKEFTFSRSEYKLEDNQEIEIADSIVWLDDIFFVVQIKLRNQSESGENSKEEKWFKNKVLKVAKKQIKNSLDYISNISELSLLNDQNIKIDLTKVPIENARKIIIYLPAANLPEKERFLKFYVSSEIGKIHLFNLEDYKWICQYLITPYEINDYLRFREEIHEIFGSDINLIPEQLILGKYISGEEISGIEPRFINFLNKFEEDVDQFNIFAFLQNFFSKTIKQESESDYLMILKELAKLSRFDLEDFKKRLVLSIENSKKKEYTQPYRMVVPRTNCGFVFVPIGLEDKSFRENWHIGLENFTVLHKYDQKLPKCIGVTIFRHPENIEWIEIYWSFMEFEWTKEEKLDKLLVDKSPFREVKEMKQRGYNFKE